MRRRRRRRGGDRGAGDHRDHEQHRHNTPAGSCEEAAVRQAIANSDAIAPSLTFEFTHLKCAEGFGWAMISADIGETATVLFKVSGTDVELLNLGTSVCATDAGIPADVAAQLAPPGRPPLGDCP